MAASWEDNTQAQQDYASAKSRRAEAAKLALQMGQSAQANAQALDKYSTEHMADFDKAGKVGAANIRSQAAESLANAQAQGGNSGYGAMLQAGKQSGMDQANFQANLTGQKAQFQQGIMEQKAAAEQAGFGQQLEAQKFIASQGDETEDTANEQAQLDAKIAQIVKNNKGFFNDDEDTMAQQIMALTGTIKNPKLRDYVQQRAGAIKTGKEDV